MAACGWVLFAVPRGALILAEDSPRKRVVHRIERNRRRDALDTELPDLIVGKEAEADLLHGMADHRPVVRHDKRRGCCSFPFTLDCRLRCS